MSGNATHGVVHLVSVVAVQGASGEMPAGHTVHG